MTRADRANKLYIGAMASTMATSALAEAALPRSASLPHADAARNAFLAALSGVASEGFAAFAVGMPTAALSCRQRRLLCPSALQLRQLRPQWLRPHNRRPARAHPRRPGTAPRLREDQDVPPHPTR